MMIVSAVPYAIVAAATARPSSSRASATSKPVAPPTPKPRAQISAAPVTPRPAPTLSEPDQFRYDLEREEHRHQEALGAGAERLSRDLTWPIVAIVFFALAATRLRQFLSRPTPGGLQTAGIPLPGDFATIAGEDQQRVAASSATLHAAVTTLPRTPTAAALMSAATVAIVPAARQTGFTAAQRELSRYFGRVYSSTQATQLQFMRALTIRPLTYGDANAYYQTSTSRGYTRRFEDWLDLLVRFGLVERQTDGSTSPYSTTVSASEIGKLFVGWCDVSKLSDRTLESAGRGY